MLWLDRAGAVQGAWAYGAFGNQPAPTAAAAADGLVLFGYWLDAPARERDLGIVTLPSPGAMPRDNPYALAVPWDELEASMLRRCVVGGYLAQVGLDVHLVFDAGAGTGGEVGGGAVVEQLAAQGLAALFQRHDGGRVSFLTPPLSSPPSERAFWPVVDPRVDPGAGGLYSLIALAPNTQVAEIGPAIERMLRGGRAISVDHGQGAVHHAVALVVAGSGPSTPAPSPAELAAVAAARDDRPAIRTHVIGLGEASEVLDGLAAAGGATATYLPVDADLTANVAAAVAEVLRPHRCAYGLPRMGVADWERATLRAWLDRENVELPRVSSCAPGGSGWTIDDRAWAPTVSLCEATCDAFEAGTLHGLNIAPLDVCSP